MCYLIATKIGQRGCIGVEIEGGRRMASLSQYLADSRPDVQVVTVGNKEAYGEYAPYDICPSEIDFIQKVLAM
ncbi:DUF6718 family protein [Selenomonas ruminantium]|jgi:hypothetical protein|uniref:DUF6718 family protein n=1 Tax=Selenomonas ruminantium TaxID=971 RepID=UPI001568C4A6|nr:DUF6718 family protein [Selenomonas ruminantium]